MVQLAKIKYFCKSFNFIMASQIQVGKAIIRLRKLRGLSQEKFALESGIDRRYISDVENGKRNVSFELLNRVVDYFKISLCSFFEIAEQTAVFKSIDEFRSFLIERGDKDTVYFANPDFVDAILGISDDGRVVYSYSRMAESLMLKEQMTYEEAVEFIDYNTIRSIPYMGNNAPIIVYGILE